LAVAIVGLAREPVDESREPLDEQRQHESLKNQDRCRAGLHIAAQGGAIV